MHSRRHPRREYSAVLNLTGLTVAGGRSVALNLLLAWKRAGLGESVLIVGPDGQGYDQACPDGAVWLGLGSYGSLSISRPYVDNRLLPRLIEEYRVPAVLTLSNIAARVPANVPQAVVIMWPYFLYGRASEAWSLLGKRERLRRSLKFSYMSRMLKYSSAIVVQTQDARAALEERLGRESDIRIIPTAPSIHEVAPKTVERDRLHLQKGSGWLCLSRYYPHKNLEVLVEAAEELRRIGSEAQIWLTLDANDDRRASRILAEIDRRDLSNYILNIGTVDHSKVPSIYAASTGVVLPTLIESYSQVFVEALAYERPLVTSDRGFARAVCGAAATYVDPHDGPAIAAAIDRLQRNPRERRVQIEAAVNRYRGMPSWEDVGLKFWQLCKEMRDRPPL